MKPRTTVERKSERELVVSRTFNTSARNLYEAWTNPQLFPQWWLPKSFGIKLISYEADVRVGGGYRLLLSHGESAPMAFHGKYLEVTPHSRIVWTNEETEGGAISTVTFEEKAGKTVLTVHELYPSKEALEENIGASQGMNETFEQLEALLGLASPSDESA